MIFLQRIARDRVSVLAPLLILGACSLAAQAPPSAPSRTESRQAPQGRRDSGDTAIEATKDRSQNRTVVVPIGAPNAENDRGNTTEHTRTEENGATTNWALIFSSAQTVSSVVLVFLTAALAIVGVLQWKTYEATLAANKAIERGSLSMATLKLERPADFSSIGWPITIELKNNGHTTAQISEAVVILRYARSLLPTPSYDAAPSKTCPPILAAGEKSTWRHVVLVGHEQRDPADPPDTSHYRYWVYGQLTFTDVFGERHVYRFGREWRPDDSLLSHKDRSTKFGYPDLPSCNSAD